MNQFNEFREFILLFRRRFQSKINYMRERKQTRWGYTERMFAHIFFVQQKIA